MRTALALAVAGGLLAPCAPLGGVEIGGSARVFGGSTERDGSDVDVVDEKYSLNLRQTLTAWLSLLVSYRHNRLGTTTEGGEQIERRSDDPLVELIYQRPNLSGRLSFQDRRTRGTSPADTLDLRSFRGQFEWRPRVGPTYTLRFRDETNAADLAVFGRDVQNRAVDFGAVYAWGNWQTRYSFQRTELDNVRTAYHLDQNLHELRTDYHNRFWDDRLTLAMDSWVRRTEQREAAPQGVALAEPLPAREGLFAVDTVPEVGELEPAPGLVDGDTENPAIPLIAIGGANTFRNVGVDLGFTRQVSQLEITVDAVSSAGLVWEVYHSSDNFNWVRAPWVAPAWDGALLRYVLRIPEITDRYFKAVNVSVNPFVEVAVTEIRALVEVPELTRREGGATTYRVHLSAGYRPTERLSASLTVGLANDQSLAGGILSRDLEEVTCDAGLRFDLTPELRLRVGYRYDDVEDLLPPVLRRQESRYQTVLDWSPLATVQGMVSVSRRDERDGDVLIRSSDRVRLRLRTDLLPDLRLISELQWFRNDDPFSGYQQSGWSFRETVESSLTERWLVAGTVATTWYDSTGTIVLTRRTNVQLRTTWSATPFLSLTGSWDYGEDDVQETLTQRYSLGWTPGPKLSASLSYQDSDAEDLRQTTGTGASLSYRLLRRLTLFTYLARSTFDQTGTERSKITSLRAGLNYFF